MHFSTTMKALVTNVKEGLMSFKLFYLTGKLVGN